MQNDACNASWKGWDVLNSDSNFRLGQMVIKRKNEYKTTWEISQSCHISELSAGLILGRFFFNAKTRHWANTNFKLALQATAAGLKYFAP